MVVINTTLSNFNFADEIQLMFENYDNDYEYTVKGVFRKINPPSCWWCNEFSVIRIRSYAAAQSPALRREAHAEHLR